MGKPVLVNLLDPNDPEAHLIVCRSCHTHIALRQHIIRSFPFTLDELYLGAKVDVIFFRCDYFQPGNLVFSNIVNVKFEDPAESSQNDDLRTLADVRCLTCGNVLGSKFIRDEMPRLLSAVPSNAGQIHLLKVKLAQWKVGQQFWNVEANDFQPS